MVNFPTIEDIEARIHRKTTVTSLIRRQRSFQVLLAIAIIGSVFAGVFVAFVPWVQTVYGTGKVIAYSPRERPQAVEAPIEGRIVKWFVQEGQRVNAEDPLVQLADIDPDIMDRLELEKDAVLRRISASQAALDTSSKNLSRQEQLAKGGLSSQRAFEMAKLEVARFEAELASAQSELARVQVRIARQTSQTVRASQAGIISRIHAPQGGVFVKAGYKLADLVPDTNERAVELYVSGNDVPLIQVGREVRLQFEGWPALQFSGWPSVAVGSFPGKVALIDPVDDGSGKFRIIVFPERPGDWPSRTYLRLGARSLGWVLLDEVSVGWELWRRFNGFPPSLSSPVGNKE